MHKGYLKKKGKFQLFYDNMVLLNQRLSMFYYLFYYLLLTVQMQSFTQCRVMRLTRAREGNRVTSQRSEQPVRNHSTSAVLTTVCVLQIHTSIITVSVTRLCSPFGLKLMVKLRTLLTVFIFTLKAEARNYGKGRYISDACLWFSANHNALGQLANQSRLCLSEGGAL